MLVVGGGDASQVKRPWPGIYVPSLHKYMYGDLYCKQTAETKTAEFNTFLGTTALGSIDIWPTRPKMQQIQGENGENWIPLILRSGMFTNFAWLAISAIVNPGVKRAF